MNDEEAIQHLKKGELHRLDALVNPETCQIIPLGNLHGYVTSWR